MHHLQKKKRACFYNSIDEGFMTYAYCGLSISLSHGTVLDLLSPQAFIPWVKVKTQKYLTLLILKKVNAKGFFLQLDNTENDEFILKFT